MSNSKIFKQANNKLPNSMLERVPFAEWLNNPGDWDNQKFITETANFLWDAYEIGTNQDKHALGILATLLETIVISNIDIEKNGLVVTHSNGVTGKNHHVDIRDKAITRAVLLMNELGLTPKGRLPVAQKMSPQMTALLAGPKGFKRLNTNES